MKPLWEKYSPRLAGARIWAQTVWLMSLSSLPLSCSPCFLMDPVSFPLLNETWKYSSVPGVPFLLCTLVHVGTDSPVTTGKKSRAGAGGSTPSHKACMQQSSINAYCLMNEAWFLLRKKQRGGGTAKGLAWQSSGGDSALPLQGHRFDPVGNCLSTSCRAWPNRKGGADTNPEPRCSDAKSTVLAHSLLPGLQLWHVHTKRYHLLGRWKHPGESRDSPPPCKPAAPWGPPWGLHQENQITTRVTCSLAVQPYTHIFSKMEIISFDDY